MELSDLKGIGKARLIALSERNMTTLEDLLRTMPIGYRDTENVIDIGSLKPGAEGCIAGAFASSPKLHYIGRMNIVRVMLADNTGVIQLNWFNQPWMSHNIKQGEKIRIWGRVQQVGGKLCVTNPEKIESDGILPRYPVIPGIPRKVFESLIDQALRMLPEVLPEILSDRMLREHHLMMRAEAYQEVHRPSSLEILAGAKRRIGFENLMLFQMAVRSVNGEKQEGIRMQISKAMETSFVEAMPFTLTGAQRAVIHEVVDDMQSGERMNRLIQGDVGSGKTVIALASAYFAAQNGWQTALMAPTEVLAQQHYQTARTLLEPLGISCGLLVGGMKASERKTALEMIESGAWKLVIGTHALISDSVSYQNLGLVMTDEQHRFGVRQRKLLSDKGVEVAPHTLVLSATPIPRTLALILYGDLDISTVDELPPGRMPVATRIVPEKKRNEMYRFIVEAASRNEQTYYVCPLVEDSEQSEAKSAQTVFEKLKNGPFKSLRLGLTFGTQKAEEKEQTLRRFKEGAIDVLVATTVIEVGIDVPSATIIVIENADRFGLSQLHQLRGRVGRGKKQSWCFLMCEGSERAKTLCATNDGFVIAQKDLDLRGPGEFLGTRQHGRIAPEGFGITDLALIEETRAEADRVLTDPVLQEEKKTLIALAQEKYMIAKENIVMN